MIPEGSLMTTMHVVIGNEDISIVYDERLGCTRYAKDPVEAAITRRTTAEEVTLWVDWPIVTLEITSDFYHARAYQSLEFADWCRSWWYAKDLDDLARLPRVSPPLKLPDCFLIEEIEYVD